jgi:WD40 repeat protein
MVPLYATMLAARRVLSQSGPFLVGSPIPAGDALSIAVSPDGAVLASAQREGAIAIIDTATGRPVGPSLHGHDGGVSDVEFSGDSRFIPMANGWLRPETMAK